MSAVNIILNPFPLTTEQIAAVTDHAANNSCAVLDVEGIAQQIPLNQYFFSSTQTPRPVPYMGDSTRAGELLINYVNEAYPTADKVNIFGKVRGMLLKTLQFKYHELGAPRTVVLGESTLKTVPAVIPYNKHPKSRPLQSTNAYIRSLNSTKVEGQCGARTHVFEAGHANHELLEGIAAGPPLGAPPTPIPIPQIELQVLYVQQLWVAIGVEIEHADHWSYAVDETADTPVIGQTGALFTVPASGEYDLKISAVTAAAQPIDQRILKFTA